MNSSKRIFVSIILLLCSSLFYSADNLFEVQVCSEDNKPLDNVYLLIEDRVYISDKEGKIVMPIIIEDSYLTLSLYRTGYRPQEFTVNELRQNKKIIMYRDMIDLYGLTVRAAREHPGASATIRITAETAGKPLADLIKDYGDFAGSALAGERRTLSLGGHHSRHLIIMLDGIPINKSGQPVDLATIPTGNLERIEIIRGGSSAEAGSGAIAGSINLITKKGSEHNEYSLAQSGGSFGYVRSMASSSFKAGLFWFDFMSEMGYARNDFSYLNRNGDEVKRAFNDKTFRNFYFKTVYRQARLMVMHKIDYRLFQNKMPGSTNNLMLYEDARLDGYGLNNDLQFNFLIGSSVAETILYQRIDRVTYDNTRAPHPFFRMKGKHYDQKQGASISLLYDTAHNPAGYYNLQFAERSLSSKTTAAYHREDFEYQELTNQRNSIPEVFTENYSLSHQLSLINPILNISSFSGDWHNSASVRYDFTDKWEDKISYRYVGSYDMIEYDLLFGLSLSSNYSLPSFYDLYWKGDCQATGNPNLMPEESFNKRFFAEYGMGGFHLAGYYENSNVDNLIYWFRSVTGWKPGNIASAEISEYNLSMDVTRFQYADLSMSYSRVEAVNKSRNKDGSPSSLYDKYIIYRPVESFRAELQSPAGYRTQLRLNHSYTGKQYSTPDQLIPALPAYHLTDIELGYQTDIGNVGTRLSLQLKNIFDNKYEIYAYTPQPGFNWMLNLKLTAIQ